MKARRIALAAGCLALLGAPASTASAADRLPDLVTEPPGVTFPDTGRHYGVEVNASTNRLVLPFNSILRNDGAGPAELIGQNPVGGQMTSVFQRIATDAAPGFRDQPSNAILRYETSDGHNHWHFMSAARYSLWTSSRSYQVGLASKIGFCLQDSAELGGPPPQGFEQSSACAQGNPNAPVDMGITPGWRDLYQYTIPLQWVDVSDVQPGRYRVRAEIDPTNVIVESQERHRPVFSTSDSTVPGFPAQPVNRRVSAGRASRITLKAPEIDGEDSTGLGNRQFRIVSKPAHGRLKQRAGRWFAGPVVTYVPRRGYTGPDTFTFQARDKATRFPLAPRVAAVTLQVGSGDGPTTIAVSGHAGRLATEASMKLVGKVLSGPSRRLTWKVNGRRGGSRRFGTISRKGLYKAPANAPGRAVRIEASTRDGRKKTVRVKIVDNAVPALPSMNTPGGSGALSRVAASRRGSLLQSKFVPGRSGKVTVSVTRKGKRLGGCKVQAVRRRPVTCETPLPRAVNKRRGELDLRVSLTRGRRTLATRARRVSLGGAAVAGTASRSATAARSAAGGPGLICYVR